MKFAIVILTCVVAAAQAQFSRASAYASVNTGFGANNQYRAQQAYRPPTAVASSSVFAPAPKAPVAAVKKQYGVQQAYKPAPAVSVFAPAPKAPVAAVKKPYGAQQAYKPAPAVSVFAPAPKAPTVAANKPFRAQQAYKPSPAVSAFAPAPKAPVAAVATASASYNPVNPARATVNDAFIVKQGNEIKPDGSYNYFYETNNGIAVQEQGTPQNLGGNPPVIAEVSQGSYSYTSPEGVPIVITYTADENGFHPQGDAIPTAPPVPPQILRALNYIAKSSPKI